MASSTLPTTPSLQVERRGIDHVPRDRRFGVERGQFTIRFAPVIYLAGIFVGATGGALGLGFWGSVTAILVANLLGSVTTGMCAVMGPKLGMPQIPMGRATFGYRGNFLIAGLTIMVCLGYYTIGTILGAKSFADLFNVGYGPMVVVVAALSILIAVYGYRFLHLLGRWITYISIVLLAAVSAYLWLHGLGAGASPTVSGGEYTTLWLLQFTVVFGYTVSWSPYASDYSRYLPENVRPLRVFGWATAGLMASTTWMMVLGAGLISLDPGGDVLDAFGLVLPGWLLHLTLLTLGLSAIPHNSVNLYSGAMSLLTCDVRIRQLVIVIASGVLGGFLALLFGGPKFQENFGLFLHVVSYYIVPWVTILAIDYFRVHSSGTDYPPIEQFYDPKGAFRGIRWSGLGALLLGIVASVPFMGNGLFTGVVAAQIGGADVSYFVSTVVAGAAYLVVLSRAGSRQGTVHSHPTI